MSADPGNSTVTALYCAASTGPTCIYPTPDYVTFWPRGVTNAAQSAAKFLSAGTYTVSTAVKMGGALIQDANAKVTTLVEVTDVRATGAN